MPTEKINTVIVGAGQAGIAMSEHLTLMGVPHVVLERSRIAERWRSERWDSLVANGPAWHDRFPSLQFDNISQEAFPPKERMAQYFEDYARMINAPVRTGVDVHQVTRLAGRSGFNVVTSAGEFEAANVVAATGPFQNRRFRRSSRKAPGCIRSTPRFTKIRSNCPQAAYWLLEQARPVRKLPKSCASQGVTFICQSVNIIVHRAVIATVITAGGWARWVCGMK
jgi:glycine/D-amino acid oxidase-like deaminating enzyme